jgi:hypothetical protein
MRIKRSLQAAALIAAAVLLGLFTVQGSYALWNATTSAAPGTVKAASFDMKMTATPNNTAVTFMTVADAPASLAITPAGALLPGQSVTGGVMITNSTLAGGTFNTAIAASKGTVTGTGDGSIAQNITIKGKVASQPSDCNLATGYDSFTTLTAPSVAKNASTVFCLQVTLNLNAPPSVKGQAVNIPLTITASQVCGVSGGC